jgi:hypothetical protein
MLSRSHIQEVCKLVGAVFFLVISLQSCGATRQPPAQTLTFDEASVPFQNTSCSTGFTLVNNASVGYTLALLTATFEDVDGETYTIELDQNEVIENFDDVVLPPAGNTHASVNFDLSTANLTPPISATVIVVGVTGGQVTHFVGNFDCE